MQRCGPSLETGFSEGSDSKSKTRLQETDAEVPIATGFVPVGDMGENQSSRPDSEYGQFLVKSRDVREMMHIHWQMELRKMADV